MTSPGPGLTEAALGRRWVVRHRLPDGSATDTIGWVDALRGDQVQLTQTDGSARRIARRDVIVARPAPPAAGGPDPLRTSPAALARHTLPGWLAYAEPLGEWTLRSAGGFSGRANSCQAVGDPGMAIEQAAEQVIAYAAKNQIPPLATAVRGSEPDLGLRALGWVETYEPTEVLVTRLAALLTGRQASSVCRLTEVLETAWWQAYQQSRPNQADPTVLRLILDGQPPRAFGSVDTGGSTVAIARGHLSGPWLGLASIWTRPDHRRAGLATDLVLSLGHWAARRGARNVYLQVAAANTSAITAYGRLGFARHHAYCYLKPPD